MSENELTTLQLEYVVEVLTQITDGARVSRELCINAIDSDISGELMQAANVCISQLGYIADLALHNLRAPQCMGDAEDWLLFPGHHKSLKKLVEQA